MLQGQNPFLSGRFMSKPQLWGCEGGFYFLPQAVGELHSPHQAQPFLLWAQKQTKVSKHTRTQKEKKYLRPYIVLGRKLCDVFRKGKSALGGLQKLTFLEVGGGPEETEREEGRIKGTKRGCGQAAFYQPLP